MAAIAAGPRRVLVTGGNKGIGRALCKQLAADHGLQVLLGSRDAGRGEAAVAAIRQEAPEAEIDFLHLDVSSDASVKAAAQAVAEKYGTDPPPLYGIVNNAGLGFDKAMPEVLGVNVYGAKRVSEAFLPLLQKGGRIVNTGSASGPMFIAREGGEYKRVLCNPGVTWPEIEEMIQRTLPTGKEAYGFSKACLMAHTMDLARRNPDLVVNACTPGFILTDITRGMGATKKPEEGTKAAIHCLMAEMEGNGRYYGSDAVRSPLDRYRGPGDPEYKGD